MTEGVESPVSTVPGSAPDRNLALELVRVTESAAMSAGRWIGRGDKISADQAAVDGMRLMLDTTTMAGVVVIGEGEKDEAPMLFNGEEVGIWHRARGGRRGRPARRHDPDREGPAERDRHDRLRRARDHVLPGCGRLHEQDRLRAGVCGRDRHRGAPAENVKRVAKALGIRPTEVTVVVLERDRHTELIEALRAVEAQVLLVPDGDVAPAIAAARPESSVDLLMGIGGTPEGVLSAAALKCVGGALQGKLWPRDDEERQQLIDAGFDLDRVLTTDDLVGGDDVFFAATGVTTGALLRGVRYTPSGAITESIIMRSRSGTVRRVEAHHSFGKLEALSGGRYGR